MARQSKRTIDLSPVEELLRKLLLDCRNHILYNSHDSADLDIWFTGGWVRDKLLGGESHDIDVALSSMTGFQFLEALDLHFHFFSLQGRVHRRSPEDWCVPNHQRAAQNQEKAREIKAVRDSDCRNIWDAS